MKRTREIMPEPPFRMMFLAKSQSGKTTMLIKLLLYYWVNMFDRIFIFCPTFNEDDKWFQVDPYVRSGKIKIHSVVTKELLTKIWADSIKKKSKDKTYQTCVIMDDCMGQEDFKTNSDQGIVNKLVCKGNHANITTIWSIQKLTLCSTIMRINVEAILMYYLGEKESKTIHAEFGTGSQSSFVSMIRECTKEPYSTFYINRQGPGEADYYKNFELIDVENYMEKLKKNKKR